MEKKLNNINKTNKNVSPWIKNNFEKIAKNSLILDLACGSGRHSILAKQLGFNVIATDIDYKKLFFLKKTKDIKVIQTDLENKHNWPFKKNIFDAVIVTNYLYRPLFKNIFYSIKPKGFLLYETFTLENKQFGRPYNLNYLLKPRELLDLALDYEISVIEYEEIITHYIKPKAIQRILGKIK